jgi:hypothetical protein
MGVGLVRKGATGSVSHSQATPTLALRDTYGATFSFIEQGHVTLLNVGSQSQPTTPAAGDLVFFSKSRAGKMIGSVVGPSGIDYNIQNALFGSTIIRWFPTNGTTISIFFGTGWVARNVSGSQTTTSKLSATAMQSMSRALFSTTAAINTSSGIQSIDTVVWRGNATGLGGFFFFARFGMVTIGTGARVLIGLSALNGTLAADPSTGVTSGLNNTIAIIKDAADTTWQVLIRNTSTLTKQNTFVTITANQILDIYIHVKPNDTSATFELRNPLTGSSLYSVTLTTGMIDGATFLYAHCQVQASAASTSQLALNQIYVEGQPL